MLTSPDNAAKQLIHLSHVYCGKVDNIFGVPTIDDCIHHDAELKHDAIFAASGTLSTSKQHPLSLLLLYISFYHQLSTFVILYKQSIDAL